MQNQVHPTADTVYSFVRAQDPNISLGTVYRNLNLLCEQGLLRKISVPDASDRFDGRCEEHYHFVCTKCAKVFDVEPDSLPGLGEQIERIPGCKVTGYQF
jgi:Fur family peroxide stress response transcriptional regulator